jgi:heat shock protein 5
LHYGSCEDEGDCLHPATKNTSTIAGLQTLCIINKSVAATIIYSLNKKGSEYQIIVYDLGGGTFNVSLLSINDGVFKVLATTNDTLLGGEDFNNWIIDYFVKLPKKKTSINVTGNLQALGKLKCEVKRAKHTLHSFCAQLLIISR